MSEESGTDLSFLSDVVRKSWRDRDAEQRFNAALADAFGSAYSEDDAEQLHSFAARHFEEADDLLAWPDVEVWELLREAIDKVEWLESLFRGQAPEDYPLPKSAQMRPHVRNKELRRLQGFDAPKLHPGASAQERAQAAPDRSVYRLRDLLSVAGLEVSKAEEWVPAWDGHTAVRLLDQLKAVIEAAADQVEPERGLANDAQQARAWKRLLNLGFREQQLSWSLLNYAGAPFKAGRPSAPEPLVRIVQELATRWSAATGRTLRFKNDGYTSRDFETFTELLRLLEAAHRRGRKELGKAVVRRALAQVADAEGKLERTGAKHE